jgi:hypothetical protein
MGGSRLFEYNIDISLFRPLPLLFTSGLGERAIDGPNTDLYVPSHLFRALTKPLLLPWDQYPGKARFILLPDRRGKKPSFLPLLGPDLQST